MPRPAAGCSTARRRSAPRAPTPSEKAALTQQIDALKRWCASCLHDPAYKEWVIFRFPETLDYQHLVQVQRPRAELPESMIGPDARLRRRDGFALTDARYTPRENLSEIHYCVLCHERDKDSCSKGLQGQGGRRSRPTRSASRSPAARSTRRSPRCTCCGRAATPSARWPSSSSTTRWCAGTGHRICNDCMKACIYQKQEPVNIPQIETGVLTDVLQMPYGVEIYGLLTRWNPLNVRRPYALPYNGRNILVVGLGPAGYTLAHYLLNEGFGVVAIDGLKIEPLPPALTGESTRSERVPQPIEQWDEIYNRLDERVLEGFGGVSEYGITVRWDKNFLTLLHLMLARRDKLRIYGGIRFGGTLPIEDAWAHGFDHIAIAAGAGKPTVIDMKNNLVRGVRKASDFLMALQLTGAFKRNALPNLQARLPAIVIGGGLTGIDTATELFAYYPIQVEKTLERYEALCAEQGEAAVRAACDAEEQEILDEFLAHGRAVRAERARAAAAGEAPDFVPLVRGWGGVTLAYRKKMTDSPAYRLNHEEVIKALEEGHPLRRGPRPEGDRRRRPRSRRGDAARRPERQRRAARAHGARRRRHVAQHHLREGEAEHLPDGLEAALLPGLPRRARERRRDADAGPGRVLHLVQRRRPADLVLRRQPPALRRQRRQGDGVGQARLPARGGALRRRDRRRSIRRRSRRATPPGTRLVRTLDARAAGRRSCAWSGSRRRSSRWW